MKNTPIFDEDLNPVLEIADAEDLEPIVQYLEQKMSESLTFDDVYKEHYPDHTKYADLIAKEVREMGGNSFANMFRGSEGPSYHEIVRDVADKLKAPYNKEQSIEIIENSILETVLIKSLEEMSDSEKEELLNELGGAGSIKKGGITTSVFIAAFRAGGFKSYKMTVIIANQIAKVILGKGLTFAGNHMLMKFLSIATGPAGWAASGAWIAADIAGTSYKVTIPTVIHVAMLRKKLNSLECSNCNAVLPDASMKFCPECGEALK